MVDLISLTSDALVAVATGVDTVESTGGIRGTAEVALLMGEAEVEAATELPEFGYCVASALICKFKESVVTRDWEM